MKFGGMRSRQNVANAGLSKNTTLCTSLGALIRLRISSEAQVRDGWYNDIAVVQVQISKKGNLDGKSLNACCPPPSGCAKVSRLPAQG